MEFSNAIIKSGYSIFQTFITEPQKDLDWKGPVEVTQSNLLLQAGLHSKVGQAAQGLIQSNFENFRGWDFSGLLFQCCTALISFLISPFPVVGWLAGSLFFRDLQGLQISLPRNNTVLVATFSCTGRVLSPMSTLGLGDGGCHLHISNTSTTVAQIPMFLKTAPQHHPLVLPPPQTPPRGILDKVILPSTLQLPTCTD